MKFNIGKLKEEQIKLAKKVIIKDDFSDLTTIGGCDQAFYENKIISSVVILEYDTLKFVEKKHAVSDITMPYVPGFLSYRESPVIVEAFSKLKSRPDVLMVDGNGILHHRRIGMASHLGLLLDQATIGVAKNKLMGEVREGKVFVDDEARAFEVKTKDFAKPVYISPGHRLCMKTSLEVFKHCMKGHKLPEPLRLAHKFANKIKNGMKEAK